MLRKNGFEHLFKASRSRLLRQLGLNLAVSNAPVQFWGSESPHVRAPPAETMQQLTDAHWDKLGKVMLRFSGTAYLRTPYHISYEL